MLRLRDIMTRDLLTIDPELSLRDAMELLARRHVGGAPVVAGHRVVGVISMTDLIQVAAALPDEPPEADPDTTPEESAEADGDPAALCFTDLWGDSGAGVGEPFEALSGPAGNALDERTVSEVMTRDVRALPSDTPVLRAAALMTEERIHRVLVMDDERLLGIVSLTDIAKAAAANKLTARAYVFGRGDGFEERGRSER